MRMGPRPGTIRMGRAIRSRPALGARMTTTAMDLATRSRLVSGLPMMIAMGLATRSPLTATPTTTRPAPTALRTRSRRTETMTMRPAPTALGTRSRHTETMTTIPTDQAPRNHTETMTTRPATLARRTGTRAIPTAATTATTRVVEAKSAGSWRRLEVLWGAISCRRRVGLSRVGMTSLGMVGMMNLRGMATTITTMTSRLGT